jgi:Leucine-rich repeat (LRR) protein
MQSEEDLLLGQRELSGASLELLLADRLKLGRRVRLLSVFECSLAVLAPQLERFRSLGVAVLLANNNALTDLRPMADAWGASLTRLYVASNALTTAEGLQRMPGLQRCDLSRNRLAELPEALPVALERLDVHGNELATVPSSLGSLGQLQRLGLHSNRPLRALPSLALLTRLTHVSCSFCSLSALPLLPPSLESLRCEGNRLTELNLSRLPQLRRLEVQLFSCLFVLLTLVRRATIG